MRRGAVAVLFALVSVAAIGCGGGGESSQPLTKAQFLRQGDAICVKGGERKTAGLKAYTERPEKSFTTEEKEQAIRAVFVPMFTEDLAGLAELNPPKGEEERVDEIIAAIESAVARVEAHPLIVLAGATRIFGEAEKLARDYGFEVCGRS